MATMDIRHRQYAVDAPIPIDQQQPNPDGPSPSNIHPNVHPMGMPPPLSVDAHSYYSNTTMAMAPHPYHPDCPNSLNCLPDTDEKPNHILPVIVRSAILGSPKQKLTIREIYKAIENKFPYFRTTEVNWKDSIRHNLSLNKLFEKVPRPLTDPGIGSYWTVNVTARGAKRPRKRKGRPVKESIESHAEQQPQDTMQPPPPPPPPHFNPPLGFPGPNTHPFMSGPPGQGLPPGFGGGDDGETGLIDPSLDPSLSGGAEDTGPRNEPAKTTISRLRQELGQAKRQYTVVAEQLVAAREDARKFQAELTAAETKLEEEIAARQRMERRLEAVEVAKADAEERLNALAGVLPQEVQQRPGAEHEADADGDEDEGLMIHT